VTGQAPPCALGPLRGLRQQDGRAVIETARDFLAVRERYRDVA
jgi:hypothetical protein